MGVESKVIIVFPHLKKYEGCYFSEKNREIGLVSRKKMPESIR